MIKLLLLGIFLTELLKYGIWFNRMHGLRFQRIGLGCGLIVSYIILILLGIVTVNTLLLVSSVVAIVAIASMLEKKKGKIVCALQVFFISLCIGEAVSLLVKVMKGGVWKDDVELRESYIVENLVVIIILCIGVVVKKKRGIIGETCKRALQWGMYGVAMLMGLTILLIITGFQNILDYIDYIGTETLSKLPPILSLAAFVFLACLVMMVAYIYDQNKKYKMYLEKDALLLKTQKNMYETILNRNEEIKSFRHDIHNHLMCLEELIHLGNLEKVRDYVEGMQGKLQPNQNKIYMVGNDVIDVVLNYYISMLNSDVKVTIEGECLRKIKMSDVELCTVVSNLIQNATEALNQLDTSDKGLEIEFVHHKGYLLMRIKNTMLHKNIKYKGEKNIFITTKKNKEQHGIGIRNAEETLVKNGGTLKFDIKQNEFVAIAMIPVA